MRVVAEAGCRTAVSRVVRSGAGEVEEAGHAGSAEEERDGTDAGVKARRVGSGEGWGAE